MQKIGRIQDRIHIRCHIHHKGHKQGMVDHVAVVRRIVESRKVEIPFAERLGCQYGKTFLVDQQFFAIARIR